MRVVSLDSPGKQLGSEETQELVAEISCQSGAKFAAAIRDCAIMRACNTLPSVSEAMALADEAQLPAPTSGGSEWAEDVQVLATGTCAGPPSDGLANPELVEIPREYLERFLEPADERLGQRSCICDDECQAFSIGNSEGDICAAVAPADRRPLREFLFPSLCGHESTHTATDPDMCVLCIMYSTAVHVIKHIQLHKEPSDILQRFRVSINRNQFCPEECWPIAIDNTYTGVPYPFPKYSVSKFTWTRRMDEAGRLKLALLCHFRYRPAA